VKSSVSTRQSFWRRVEIDDGCWNWLGEVNRRGYARMNPDKPSMSASRYVWQLFNGAIPRGMLVCHKCDNRRCVRPDHLFLGTALDNMHDAMRKGRWCILVGEDNAMAKLNALQVRIIRRMKGMVPQRYLSTLFRIDQSQISRIQSNKFWRQLGGKRYVNLEIV
jgi:hypothetical protein